MRVATRRAKVPRPEATYRAHNRNLLKKIWREMSANGSLYPNEGVLKRRFYFRKGDLYSEATHQQEIERRRFQTLCFKLNAERRERKKIHRAYEEMWKQLDAAKRKTMQKVRLAEKRKKKPVIKVRDDYISWWKLKKRLEAIETSLEKLNL